MARTSTRIRIKSGRSYQVEINGAVAERFRARHSTELSVTSLSELLDVMLCELPGDFDPGGDPNALPYAPTLAAIRVGTNGNGDPVGHGLAALFGATRDPGVGEYTAVYPDGLVQLSTGNRAARA